MTPLRALPLLVLVATLSGCSGDSPAASACKKGATACLNDPARVLVCGDSGWTLADCDPGQLCHEGACKPLACIPKSRTCQGGAVVLCNDDGSKASEPLFCGSGKVCVEGDCRDQVCVPGAQRCAGSGAFDRCDASGGGWARAGACAGGTTCIEGSCLANACTAGAKECGPTTLFVCTNNAWTATACPAGQPCLFGQCVECVSDEGCEAGQKCDAGACVDTTPTLVTETLPDATAGQAYSFRIVVAGGKAPFKWVIAAGTLPTGIALSGTGELSGTCATPGSSTFDVAVTDDNGASDRQTYTLEVSPQQALRITTTTLPEAEMGLDYEVQLQAAGGLQPYAWQAMAALPTGLSLFSDGRLAGIPEDIGEHPVKLRVLDAMTPPGYAAKDFTLKVKIAPLEIIGDQSYNLLITKVIILPMLVQFIPYNEQLQARGGLRPYQWQEMDPPVGMNWLIPTWGLPNGLMLQPDGKLAGTVTDTSTATVVRVPLGGPTLTGYFFSARVADHQNPSATKDAVFCIPTVPLAIP